MAISDITKPMALDETLQATNGKMDSVITKLQGIIDALGLDTSVYKPKGNIACAQLVPALLIESNIGNVYNVTDNGTTTSDFVEGAGKPIHVGDNVAIVDIGTGGQSEYKFDLLAGMVDLTNYVQKSQTAGLLKNDGTVDTKDYAEKVSSATNGNLAGLNGTGNLTDSGWNGAKDTTSISGNPISISGLKANQLAKNPIITFEPIQAGSGTPSPSNIRAISGYDKIEVLSCGKNIWLNGNVSGTAFVSVDLPYILKAGTYTLSAIVTSSDTDANGCLLYDTTNNVNLGSIGRGSTRTSRTFTISTPCKQLTFYASTSYQYSLGDTFSFVNIQLEESSSATTYTEPHKTTDLSESLGQTVYGATYYPRTGILKSKTEAGFFTVDGTANWQEQTSGSNKRYYVTGVASNVNESSTDHICNMALVASNNASQCYTVNDRFAIYAGSNGTIYLSGNIASDVTALKTLLNATPLEVCYTVADAGEKTIQLTPHEISLLKDYAYVSTNGTNIQLYYHNGEMASLADVSQLGETVNELGDIINSKAFKDIISQAFTTTSANSWQATGITFTAKQGKLYGAYGLYQNVRIIGIGIGSPNQAVPIWKIETDGSFGLPNAIIMASVYADTILELYVKTAAAGLNPYKIVEYK